VLFFLLLVKDVVFKKLLLVEIQQDVKFVQFVGSLLFFEVVVVLVLFVVCLFWLVLDVEWSFFPLCCWLHRLLQGNALLLGVFSATEMMLHVNLLGQLPDCFFLFLELLIGTGGVV